MDEQTGSAREVAALIRLGDLFTTAYAADRAQFKLDPADQSRLDHILRDTIPLVQAHPPAADNVAAVAPVRGQAVWLWGLLCSRGTASVPRRMMPHTSRCWVTWPGWKMRCRKGPSPRTAPWMGNPSLTVPAAIAASPVAARRCVPDASCSATASASIAANEWPGRTLRTAKPVPRRSPGPDERRRARLRYRSPRGAPALRPSCFAGDV